MSIPIGSTTQISLELEGNTLTIHKQNQPISTHTLKKNTITTRTFQNQIIEEISKHERLDPTNHKIIKTLLNDHYKELTDQPIKERRQQTKTDHPPHTRVRLIGNNVPVITFTSDISHSAYLLEDKLFFHVQFNEACEIINKNDTLKKKNTLELNRVDARRLLNILEEQGFCFYTYDNKGDIKDRSPTKEHMELLLKSSVFQESLQPISRFFNYPFFYTRAGKLLYTTKGYYPDLQAYCTSNIELERMPAQTAKEQLETVLSGFCFETEEDKTMALAYLLTGACRGLYERITCRTPLFIIAANRERAGKDYLAGTVGIIYDGEAQEDPPIVSDKEKGNNMGSEELRKYITTKLKSGARRFHSSNNRGFLGNALFEKALTNEDWTDRLLGRNEQGRFNNELEFSLSANTGLTYTADLFHRSRRISLFFAEEDPNEREFPIQDLWGYVKAHRGRVLSAIYSLVADWVEAGKPSQSVFTSFPEWARVVGGIMGFHALGDPCVRQKDDVVGGDSRTQDMKRVFEYFGEFDRLQRGLKAGEIIQEIVNKELDVFPYWDLNERGGRTKFGLLLTRFRGRVLSGVRLVVDDPDARSSRVRYFFKKEGQESGNVGNVGNVTYPQLSKTLENNRGGQIVTMVTKVTNSKAKTEKIIRENPENNADLLFQEIGEEEVKQLCKVGFIARRNAQAYFIVDPVDEEVI